MNFRLLFHWQFLSKKTVKRHAGNDPGDQGIALISVLWIILILSILSTSVLALARIQSLTSDHLIQYSIAETQADAAIYLTIQKMSAPGAVREIPPEKSKITVTFEGQKIEVEISPESGKIDLNHADPLIISALLAYFNLDKKEAVNIANQIVHMREESSSKPFKSIDEIEQFENISDQLFQCIRPYLTVYNDARGIDLLAADEGLLKIIRWADKHRWGGRNWMEISGTSTGGLVSGGGKSVRSPIKSHTGRSYTLQATVEKEDGLWVSKTVTFRLTGFSLKPLWIYRWQKSFGPAECSQGNSG